LEGESDYSLMVHHFVLGWKRVSWESVSLPEPICLSTR
jgi:hypothetical protein